jgi:quercetin dioxygenase-like cupin family protein
VALIDTRELPVVERKRGWYGRYFNSANMTFGLYEFDEGAIIDEHQHPQEEVWHVLEGRLELTIGGATCVAEPGVVAVLPAHAAHAVKALTRGKAIVVDHPIREVFGKV